MASPSLHILQRRVYYADTDAGGVVHHAAYLAMAEQARTEALIEAGAPHEALVAEHDRLFMVRRVNLEYLRPARLDDLLTVTTAFTGGGGATVTARQSFARAGGTECVRMTVLLVCVDRGSGRPARIPPRWQLAAPEGMEDGAADAAPPVASKEALLAGAEAPIASRPAADR